MNPIQQLLTALVFVALAFPAGAEVRCPAPGVGGDVSGVSYQQGSGQQQEEEEEEEEEEEPDCE